MFSHADRNQSKGAPDKARLTLHPLALESSFYSSERALSIPALGEFRNGKQFDQKC